MIKLWQAWMWVCCVIVTLALFGGIGYLIYHWHTASIAAANQAIESCLDEGGSWNAEQGFCVHSS